MTLEEYVKSNSPLFYCPSYWQEIEIFARHNMNKFVEVFSLANWLGFAGVGRFTSKFCNIKNIRITFSFSAFYHLIFNVPTKPLKSR